MPELVELHREWSGRGVRVVAVSIDLPDPVQVKTAEELGAFVERRQFALPVVAFQGDLDALNERYKLPGGPPVTLVFDKSGKEVGRIEGGSTRSELEALLTNALGR